MCPMHYHLSLVASLNIAQAKSWTSWRSPRPTYLIWCVSCITDAVQSHLFPTLTRQNYGPAEDLQDQYIWFDVSHASLKQYSHTFSHVDQAKSWTSWRFPRPVYLIRCVSCITDAVQSHLFPTLSRRDLGLEISSLTQYSHTFLPRCCPGEFMDQLESFEINTPHASVTRPTCPMHH